MDEDEYESLPPNASTRDHMIAGAAAGIMEHCIIYPVDVVKTRMMCLKPDPNARYTGIVDAFVKIVRNEGAFRPVRGMGVVAFGAGPAHALYFSCYELCKNRLSGSVRPGDNHKINFIAGCFATLLHDAVMVPSDVIKQRLQMYNSPYRGMIDCVTRTWRREGLRAFYRSYGTQLSMNIPFQCTHLVSYDLLQSRLNPKREYNPASHCVSGALAGALAAALTTPLDVCKTLLNTQECCNPDELCKSAKTIAKTTTTTTTATIGAAEAASIVCANAKATTSTASTAASKLSIGSSFIGGSSGGGGGGGGGGHKAAFVRAQSTTAALPTHAKGLRDAVRIIYSSEGYRGFFKGLVPRTIFQIPGTAVSWSVYEYFKHSLNKRAQSSSDEE